MNVEINKQISQFLDDELHHQELEDLLLRVTKEPELQKKLDRYQSVSYALKTDEYLKVKDDFLSHIKHQVNQEPHHFLPSQLIKRKPVAVWQKVSLAMAASVACVSIVVSQQDGFTGSIVPQQVEMVSQQINFKEITLPKETVIVAQAQTSVAALKSQNSTQQPRQSQHERFKAYLQAHSNDLYTHGSFRVQPYARVAGYGKE